MKVVDSERWSWILFDHEKVLYLDVHCNMSAFSYSFMIQLSENEQRQYAKKGRQYLCELAHDVHYSVPIAKESSSIYKGRDVSKMYSDLASEAIKIWRDGKNEIQP